MFSRIFVNFKLEGSEHFHFITSFEFARKSATVKSLVIISKRCDDIEINLEIISRLSTVFSIIKIFNLRIDSRVYCDEASA